LEWALRKYAVIQADNITYHIDLIGSVEQYKTLLEKTHSNYHLVLYNGDWDSYVPYTDTLNAMTRIFYLEAGFRLILLVFLDIRTLMMVSTLGLRSCLMGLR
jgi:hypothetical protein